MPINHSNIKFTGNDGGVCAYYSRGQWIHRSSTSLTGARVKKDPAFAGFRESGNRMKQASPIAARLYQQIPKDKKEYKLYRILTGEALKLLKQGVSIPVITETLRQQYIDPVLNTPAAPVVAEEVTSLPARTFWSELPAFTRYPVWDRTRSLRRRRVLQRGDDSVQYAATTPTATPARPTSPQPAPVVPRIRTRYPPQPPVPGAIYLGRVKDFRKIKQWLLPVEGWIDLRASLKSRKYVPLF